MADGYISQIKTPDNKVYLLKDSEKTDEKVKQSSNTEDKEFPIILKNTNNTTNETNGVKYAGGVTVNPSEKTVTATEFIGNIKAGKIIPTIKKTYTDSNFYGTADSEATCCKFFISVKPDGWYKPWQIRFKVRSYCPDHTNADSVTWCTLNGRADSLIYANWNEHYDTGHYYIICRVLKNAGFNNGLGHAVGVNIRYTTGRGNSAYYRTIELDYYDCENCTVTVLDNAVLWENWTNGTDANYNGWNNLDAVNRGLRETSDDNDTGTLQMHNGYFINNSSIRMPTYTLFGFDREGKGQAISLYQADYTGGTVNISTNRVYNTKGIDYTRGIYHNSGGNYAINAIVTVAPRIAAYACDFRYTDNCVASGSATTLGMVREKPVYFRGTINDDGLFYLAPIEVTYNGATYKRAWVQDIPTTADGYVYWFIGYPYYNSSYAASLYQINLHAENPLYWFHNGRFEEYKPPVVEQIGTSEAKDYSILLKYTNDTDNEINYIKYSNNVTADATTTKPFTFNPSTGNLTVTQLKIGTKNDNMGLFPNLNNWNQIGASNLYWYRSYINNYYGGRSHVDNWDSGKNIGTATSASAAAVLGTVNFYNTAAAGATQTKTLLTADSTTNSNITITLPKTTGTLALKSELPTLSGLSGIGTISASGTAPLTLSGSKSGTTYTLTGSIADASASASGIVNTDAQVFGGVKTFDNGIHVYGTISTQSTGSTAGTMYPGGAYHSGHNSIILHGDTSGVSGIGFTSEKATKSGTTTNINSSSDRAFIQYHAYGVTPAAEGTAPTLATSGESGVLVLGVGNDATDTIRLQAPGNAGILHQIGATAYPIPHTTNTNGSVGGTTTPVYVEAGVIKALSYTIAKSVPSDAVFTDHYAWGDITSKPDTATRWPKWNEIVAGADALSEGTSNWTDNTEILTSYASNNGFADSAAKGVVYRRDALCAYNYIKGKLDSVYIAKTAGVTAVTWDETNKKLTCTINGTAADVMTAAQMSTALGLGSIATYTAATAGTKDTWGKVPVIGGTDGVMEVGKYIDFHTTDGNTADYDVRITAATTGLTISGTTSGTFSGSLSGNATTATTASKLGSSNVGSARQAIYLSGGTATAGNYTVAHLGNAGKSNMNDVGRMWPSSGMTSLTSTSNADTPKNGDTYSSGWHLYWDTCYSDDPNASNAWVAQIVNKAGTSQWWVRSRSGSTITNGTAWASSWRHLVTSTEAAVGSSTQPVYVNDNGELQAISYTIAKSVPSNAVFTDTNNAATHTLSTTAKYYVTGTTSASTSTGGDTFDTGIYATTIAGQLNATTFKVNEAVTLQYNTTDQSLDFIF